MKIVRADPERRIDIPGVPRPVQRPVEVDRSNSALARLRSLRIYRFDAGTPIEGHAEDDEVYVVILEGSVEFAASWASPETQRRIFHLSAPNQNQLPFCAAYLPPQAAYRLVATSNSVVAYARATPPSGNPPIAFQASGFIDDSAVKNLLEERTYAQHLRLGLFHITADASGVDFRPIRQSQSDCEALVHIQFATSGRTLEFATVDPESILIESGDTLAISPGEHPRIRFARGSSALALVVSAV